MPVEIIWKGPLREDDRDQQIQVVENFTSRRVSGIVLAPLDSQALVNPVESAVQSGIPVVVMDSGLKSDKYISFVATDNFKGGQLAGDYMAKLLNGKGNVILLRYAVGSASTEEREKGFLDALTQVPRDQNHFLRSIRRASRSNWLTRPRRISSTVSAAEVNGVFCVTEPTTIAMTKALRDIGKAGGKVKMIGFDSGSQSVLDMKNGDIQGLVVQNPLLMGELAVTTMVKHLRGEPVEKRIDTGVVLVTPGNMDQPDTKDLLQPPVDQLFEVTRRGFPPAAPNSKPRQRPHWAIVR